MKACKRFYIDPQRIFPYNFGVKLYIISYDL